MCLDVGPGGIEGGERRPSYSIREPRAARAQGYGTFETGKNQSDLLEAARLNEEGRRRRRRRDLRSWLAAKGVYVAPSSAFEFCLTTIFFRVESMGGRG